MKNPFNFESEPFEFDSEFDEYEAEQPDIYSEFDEKMEMLDEYAEEQPDVYSELDEMFETRPVRSPTTRSIMPALGTFACVEKEVSRILANPTEARRWAARGRLLPSDVKIKHPGPGSANRFRPVSPIGFGKAGSFKSNVFALDIAWRCGFHVPLINVGTDAKPEFIYPLANMLTTYAERNLQRTGTGGVDVSLIGKTGARWGFIESVLEAEHLNNIIKKGNRILILVGWRRSGIGHVGIIRRILSVKKDVGIPGQKPGHIGITDITYEGWEATTSRGAIRVRWNWRTTQCGRLTGKCTSNPPGNSLHNFCAIQIIGLPPQTDPALRGVKTEFVDKCSLL